MPNFYCKPCHVEWVGLRLPVDSATCLDCGSNMRHLPVATERYNIARFLLENDRQHAKNGTR